MKVWTTDDEVHVQGTFREPGGFEDKRFAMILERESGPLDEYLWPRQPGALDRFLLCDKIRDI